MRKFLNILFVIVLLSLIVFVVPAFALQTPEPPPSGVDIVGAVTAIFVTLVGWPSFLAAVLNLFKFAGWLPDNAAPVVNFWANIVAFVGVAVAVFTGQLDILSKVDVSLGNLANVITQILILLGGALGSMTMTANFHKGLRGLPLVGYSHTLAGKKK